MNFLLTSIYLYAIWIDKQRKKFRFQWKKSKFYFKFLLQL